VVSIEKSLCISCGLCVSLRPDIFQMKDNKVFVKMQPLRISDVAEIMNDCPVGAIRR